MEPSPTAAATRFDVASGFTMGGVTEFIGVSCPYCGVAAELDVDDAGGSRQSLVQDCPVCCQPWQIEVTRDRDGEWSATVRTMDE